MILRLNITIEIKLFDDKKSGWHSKGVYGGLKNTSMSGK